MPAFTFFPGDVFFFPFATTHFKVATTSFNGQQSTFQCLQPKCTCTGHHVNVIVIRAMNLIQSNNYRWFSEIYLPVVGG